MPDARGHGVWCCAGHQGGVGVGGSSDPTGATYERVKGDPDPRLRPGHVCADVVRGGDSPGETGGVAVPLRALTRGLVLFQT